MHTGPKLKKDFVVLKFPHLLNAPADGKCTYVSFLLTLLQEEKRWPTLVGFLVEKTSTELSAIEEKFKSRKIEKYSNVST